MASNAVEATLRSKYEDGIQTGIENTRALMEQTFTAMKDVGAGATAALGAAFEGVAGAMENYRKHLSQAADDSDSGFKRMALAAAAMGVGVGEIFVRASKAAADFVLDLVKEASEVSEVRLSFEALTAAQGQNADVLLGKLKAATEGEIGQLTLLRDANKVLTADLPLTSDQYVKLTENVMRLSKSAGTDAVAAQDALTTALIRGQSRGLGPAIGIHLAVKDAVAAMTEEMNTSADAMPSRIQLQAMYNDLLAKTNAAVAQLPPPMRTLEGTLVTLKTAWSDWLEDVGTAITRSGVFQEVLDRVSASTEDAGIKMDRQRQIALATNETLIGMLRTLTSIAQALGLLSLAWDALSGGIVAAVLAIVHAMTSIALAVITSIRAIVEALAMLPGEAGAAFRPLLAWLDNARNEFQLYREGASDALSHSFDGLGDSKAKLDAFANSTTSLADQMETLRGKVLAGTDGIKKLGKTAQDTGGDQRKLNDQLKIYNDLMFNLAQATAQTPEQTAMNELVHTIMEIQKLDQIKPEQRAAAEQAAWDKYFAQVAHAYEEDKAKQVQQNDQKLDAEKQYQQQVGDLQRDLTMATSTEEEKAFQTRLQDIARVNTLVVASSEQGKALLLLVEKKYDDAMAKIQADRLKKQQEDEQKALNDALAAGNAILHAVEAAQKGTIPQSAAMSVLGNLPSVLKTLKAQLADLNAQKVVTDAQIAQITKLTTAIEQLNKINFKPFSNTLNQMKSQMAQFATSSLQSFAQYLGGLLNGQEQTNKSLLALAGQMVGGLLSMAGTMLMQTGVAECAAAMTMVGRALGASWAGGLEAIAAGVALSAIGSALGGSGSGASASAPTAGASAGVSTTSTAPSQTMQVGAPAPRQAPQQPQQHVVTLQVKSNDSHIVSVVQNNLRTNGQLRVAVKNA